MIRASVQRIVVAGATRTLLPAPASALAERLLMPLPHWLPGKRSEDFWQITAWGLSGGM